MGVEDFAWTLLGTPFRCRGLPAGARTDLAALLQGFPSSSPPPADTVDFQIEAGARPDSSTLVDGYGRRWNLPGSGADPIGPHLEYRLVNEAIERARGHYVLHTGAVATAQGTCLILGESGAGKTSLTLWLWMNGLLLVTDDLCPLAHGALAPEVFPRALHMDAPYSPCLLARLPPRPDAYPADYYPFPGRVGVEVPPVRRLLVLERGPHPEGELEPLGQSEAAHHLLRAVIKSPGFQFARALEDMLRLSAQCRAHRLRSSTPEGAGAQALEFLGEV
jgi:hypothetical protein